MYLNDGTECNIQWNQNNTYFMAVFYLRYRCGSVFKLQTRLTNILQNNIEYLRNIYLIKAHVTTEF